MQSKKELFYIADLCIITNMKETTNENNQVYTRYYYKTIKKILVYPKKNFYIDIETKQKYTTSYENKNDKFIKMGSILPFSSYLKSKRIQYNNSDINNKNKVKTLYYANKKIG